MELCEIENMIFFFLTKNVSYKTKVVNLFLKYFPNNWNFVKVILKPGFVD